MGQQTSNEASVIGHQFVAPYPIDIIVESNSKGKFVVTDTENKLMLKVKPCDSTFHHQRLLLSADDKPILMLRDKILSSHTRWNAFWGKSTSNSDLAFSTKTPSIIQFRKSLHVFLANKTSSKGVCDFKIKGSWSKKNCTVYIGDSSTIIAQMHKMQKSKKVKSAKGKFMVTISKNADYSFVIALIAIVHAMKSTEDEYAEQIIASVGQVIVATV
ncbi:unnamed protein product [Lactuca saligna]|uniref:Protein LURP-one-related 15 n=1 Tax=Lactuca saligna TaxID=75948 RepID=A0AA35YBV1_LACSI|nr:unnamed protein product [Lactuca saligna]